MVLGIEYGLGGLAGLLDLDYFAALIVTAFRANTMRHFPLVTVRTLGERVFGERIMSAPGAGTLLRMSPFWIRHKIPYETGS